MKKIFFTLLFTISISQSFAQKKYDKIWEAIIKNDRQTALKLAKKIKYDKADMEGVVLKQVAKHENGYLFRDKEFIEAFAKQPDFEYYLYALWNRPFVFDDLLKEPVHRYLFENIDYLYKQKINQPLVKESLIYYKAALDKDRKKIQAYKKAMQQINALKKWQYCGVFENLNNSGINIPYPPEKYAFSKMPFDANSNGKVNWYTPVNHEDVYQFFTNHLVYGSGINYAQTFVQNPQEREVYLQLGSGDAFKVWLDDVLVYENTKEDRLTDMNAYTLKVNLPKGNNRILIKTTNSKYAYVIVRITDKNGNPISGITDSNQYKTYHKATKQEINPKTVPNIFEEYFKNKLKQHPDSYFYKYCLLNTYLRNSKAEAFYKLLSGLTEKYPKSSFLRKYEKHYYEIEKNTDKIKEIDKNMEQDDLLYYLVQINKISDVNSLLRKDKTEMLKDLEQFKSSIHIKLFDILTNLIVVAREEDKEALKNIIDELIVETKRIQSPKLIISYAPFYRSGFNDEAKTIELYKYIIDRFYYPDAYYKLAQVYKSKHEEDKVLQLIKDLYQLDHDNDNAGSEIINQLYSMRRYKEALKYTDTLLTHFPYDFVIMENKGDNYLQLHQKKEALKWYKKSLSHNSGKISLRKTINDLENKEDPLKKLIVKDCYDYIKKNRGKIKENNYGINVLLDDENNLVYEEGGSKTHNIYIYEVTSDNGIEMLKEYNLGLSGNYNIIKSEIVKPNGSIVPADRSGSKLVFKNLNNDDVVYIDYEYLTTKTGRFYKDYTDDVSFDSYHPILNRYYRIITPKKTTIKYKETLGKIPFKKKSMGDFDIYEWYGHNQKPLASSENFMPEFVDISRSVHISTIKSWQNIARWYADLIDASIKYNQTVNKTFDEIFPNGYRQLTDHQKAKAIYDYIMTHINYSFVDFRQSGHIPQRPSKTIETKLGDCKDLSTLFLTLGRKAGLKVNLVLVLTNDNGINNLVMPSIGFNHAIAKVMLDGKEQFLELTDKYLPFKSLPTGLKNATVLEIPYKNEPVMHNTLFHLTNISENPNLMTTTSKYVIGENEKTIDITVSGTGRAASKFNNMLKKQGEEVTKKNILGFFNDLDKLDIALKNYKIIQSDVKLPETKFKVQFEIKNPIQKLGKSHIFKLPLQLNPYTSNLISLKERKYPIEYFNYEYIDKYDYSYDIQLPKGKKFTAIPESQEFSYKKHHFSISYQKKSENELQVHIIAETSYDRISPEEYPAFKKYVKQVLEAGENLIGYE